MGASSPDPVDPFMTRLLGPAAECVGECGDDLPAGSGLTAAAERAFSGEACAGMWTPTSAVPSCMAFLGEPGAAG